MNRKIFLSGVLFLLLLVAGIYLIYDARPDGADPWQGIPAQSALVIEIDRPGELYAKLSGNNELWDGIRLNRNTSGLEEKFAILDSILYSMAQFSPAGENPLIVSIMPGDIERKFHTLYISTGHADGSLDHLRDLLGQRPGIEVQKKKGDVLVIISNGSTRYYVTETKGLLAASRQEHLLDAFVRQISGKEGPLSDDPELTRLRSYAGSNVDARLYVNYRNLARLLGQFGDESYQEAIAWVGGFARWTETDLILKKDGLLMTGFTLPADRDNSLLAFFRAGDPVPHRVFNVLPFNTNTLIALGKSSFEGYPSPQNIAVASRQLDADLSEIFKLIRGEIAWAGSASKPAGSKAQSWFFIQADEPGKLSSFFDKLSRNSGAPGVSDHENYAIGKINYNGLIPAIFGDAFALMEQNYYTFIDDFAVFANSRESLVNLIRMYETGKTLDLNENFKILSDNIGESSNILLYLKPLELTGFLPVYLGGDYQKTVKDNADLVRSILGLSFQFNGGEELVYTSFYLKGSKSYKEENLAVWKAELDDQIVGRPALVQDHNTGDYNMVVFDQAKNMYLVATDGQLTWKRRIDALPESDIFEVDYYRNGKIQYLFNTRDFIYLVDKNGDNVDGYPRKLNPSATNGLNLFDYSNQRDYRLMLALADKRIYNYKLDGSPVQGWSKPRTGDIVLDPVQRLVADGKDYFIINDANNDLTIVNRRGNVRIRLKQDPERAKHSAFYVNKTNSKGIILSTDVRGKLFYISTKGSIDYTDFGDFSPSHFFLYEDFNGDGAIDFIFLDGNDLTVFDRFKNILFTYQFESPISIKPEFFRISGNSRVLGVVADREKTIYLFDNKGNTLISKGLVGETPFTVGSLQNNADVNLITAAGSTLFNYRID